MTRKTNGRVGFAAAITALSAFPIAASAQIVLPPGQTVYDVTSGTQDLAQQVTGTGGIDKTGAGILQFSYTGTPATNYSGPTNIIAGSISANGLNTLSPQSAFNISSGAVLSLNNHDNTIAALSGNGTVDKGNGALTVGGDNSSTTFSGKITGTLVPFSTGGDQIQFTKTGTGTLTLTGTNDYRGTTRIAGGTLRAGSTTSLTGTMLIESGATLDLNGYSNIVGGIRGAGNISLGNATLTIFNADNSTAAPMTGAITGTGGLNIARAGNVILAGDATYSGPTMVGTSTSSLTAGAVNAFSPNSALQMFVSTVSLNGFDQTIGSLSGEGSNLSLGSARLTMGGDNTSTVYHGSISGTGGLTKVGTGQFTLNLPVTYTGATIVNAGTFRLHPDGVLPGTAIVNGGIFLVEGKVNGPVTVNGGTLKGTGSVGGMTVNNATLAPGNSIGTMNIAGNLSFGPSSVYQVEADASGAADRIAATGSAALGGTVQVIAADGTYAPSTSYTILSATGGITGTFAGVSDNLAFLDSSLGYSGDRVTLTLTRNDTDFSAVTATPNQNATANAIESAGFGTPIYNALLGASAAEARRAFDILSGSIHASMLSAQLEDGQSLRSAMLTQLRSNPQDDSDIRTWGNVLANWSSADSAAGIIGMDQDIVSLQAGADMRIGDGWRVGLTLGYDISHLDQQDKASRARMTGWHSGIYGQGLAGPIALRGGALFYSGYARVNRDIAFLNFTDAAYSKQAVTTHQVFGEAGYPAVLGDWQVEPFAGLAWVQAEAGGANESGGAAALRIRDGSLEQTYLSLGGTASRTASFMGLDMTPSLRAAWQHGLSTVSPLRITQLSGAAISQLTAGLPPAEDRALVNADIGIALDAGQTLRVGYQGALSSGATANGILANVSLAL